MVRSRHTLALLVGFLAVALTGSRLIAAAPQLKIYFAADFKDSAYQQAAYKKVAAAWKRPPTVPEPGGKTVVIAVIRKDGSAPGPTLHYKSGSDTWDAAALEAVKKAAPFDPLPKTYPRPTVEVHFHFEYD
ncbi:MAG: energy transducer TonB [Acidobacteria bacterium]|nr:MAG: energy transducer TonB [Acidobacteriota bacterium]